MPPRELPSGWYFEPRRGQVGCGGIVINKKTGEVFGLGSGRGVERDLWFYEKGYQSERYDLVVVVVRDIDVAVEHLYMMELDLGEEGTDPKGFPISHRLMGAKLRERLAHLPCVFGNQHLYFTLETLEKVEQDGSFEFTAVPAQRQPSTGD